MANTVKEIGIKQHDGNYQTKDVGVSYTNVEGLSTEATAFKALSANKATTDKNNKDITTYIASISKNGSKIRTTNGAGDNLDIGFTMTGASSSTDGVGGFVPTPTKGNQNKFLKGNGTWDIPQDTTYTGSSNIDVSSSNVIDLKNTTVTANTYGPTADVTGSNGATIKVPKFTVDAKGRITSAGTQTFTAVNTTYSAGTGLSLSGTTFSLGSHASGGTGYGIGTGTNYGHVKLSDTYSSKVSGGAAANGVAASQNALYNAYNTLNTGKATNNHTHEINIAVSSGTNQLTLASSTKYVITAGGSSYIFTTPSDNNTTTGDGIKTKVAKTGTGTTVTSTISASTTMDNAIGTLLNNDTALLTNINSKVKVNNANVSTVNFSYSNGVLEITTS